MNQCTSQEKFNYVFLTKETRDEFLDMAEPGLKRHPDAITISEDNDKEVVVEYYKWSRHHYYYNFWYVLENAEWFKYTQEEFEEYFSLVGDENS